MSVPINCFEQLRELDYLENAQPGKSLTLRALITAAADDILIIFPEKRLDISCESSV